MIRKPKDNEYKLIKCGKLFNGIQEALLENMEILVQGEKIKAVGKDLQHPQDAEIIDLSDCTVTPGMIDAHTHLTFYEWSNRKYETVFNSPVYKSMAVLYNAERALRRGFTTLRHMGGNSDDGYGALDAKRSINEGYFAGSRLCVLPYVQCTVGSHGDSSQQAMKNPALAGYLCSTYPAMGSGVDFFRNSVREQVKLGADFVKLMSAGGFSTPNDSPDDEQMSDEEMQVIIETAHKLYKKCTAHVYAAPSMIKLANMGIDELQHCSLMTEESLELLEKKNIPIVPTFSPYEEIIHLDEAKLAQKDAAFQAKMRQYEARLRRGRELIVNSNLKLGYGSDLVTVYRSYHGAVEYSSMMNSGVPAFRILKAATSVNAELLEMDDIGSIREGKLADIAAWRRDLLHDPDALKECAFVMKGGVVFETEPFED